MADDPVLLEVKGGVAVLTLDRPDEHNITDDAVDALFFRYLDLLRTDRDVRVVVWRANGPSFSAGRDLGHLGACTATGDGAGVRHPGLPSDFELLERTAWSTRLLYEFPVPIVCALKGWTLGTMFERALLCDIRVAGEDTRMALPAVDHGLIPDGAGLAKLVEIGGSALALDLALTGRRIDAAEALRLGLVSRVVPDDELDDVVAGLARGLAARPPLVLRLVRESVQALAGPGVRDVLGRELVGQAMVLASHDYREHHQARAEDREPRYERR
ncbi:MAG TPA: enoyl-CoA hydratase/isomerase family protein [Acidimicrobiales bacterium]|nr:enoyl-CoA hydratase/isomerase family protein [Acidimicrobiales bacterium]